MALNSSFCSVDTPTIAPLGTISPLPPVGGTQEYCQLTSVADGVVATTLISSTNLNVAPFFTNIRIIPLVTGALALNRIPSSRDPSTPAVAITVIVPVPSRLGLAAVNEVGRDPALLLSEIFV